MSDQEIGAAIAEVSRTVQAPPELRRRIAEQQRRPSRARRPLVPRLALSGAVAAIAAAVVLLVSGGGPTVGDVAAAALQPPTRAVPSGHGYGDEQGWKVAGERIDRVGGRRAVTVVYRRGGMGVHYTILDGDPIARPDGRRVMWHGRAYTVLRSGGAAVVTWEQHGHTCVLASRMLDGDGLLKFLFS